MTDNNQVLYITTAERIALLKMTQSNGQTLEVQYSAARLYVVQDWAVNAVLTMRGKQ